MHNVLLKQDAGADIEWLIEQILKQMRWRPINVTPEQCSAKSVSSADLWFIAEFHHSMSEAYKQIMHLANGLEYNELVIWPCHESMLYDETIHKVNARFRGELSPFFLYYGSIRDELYVFDLRCQTYCAIEKARRAVWKCFEDDESMFRYMLERSL